MRGSVRLGNVVVVGSMTHIPKQYDAAAVNVTFEGPLHSCTLHVPEVVKWLRFVPTLGI